MRKVSFSTDVYASLQIVWQLLLDKIEKPQNYNSDIGEVKILERYDDGLLREFRTQGIVIKERVTINEARGEVSFFIVEHPLFFGQVINRVVPSSVQSPVAPQVFTIVVDWGPKNEGAEVIIRAELPAQVQLEVLSLKNTAEALERADD